MQKLLICALLLCLAAFPATADTARVSLDGFSFAPPEGLSELAIDEEARQSGVVYAAQSKDGATRMLAVVRRVRRSMGATVAALLNRLDEREGATLDDTVTVGDTEFALTTEALHEGDQALWFRTAAAVRGGRQLLFFFIDRDGSGETLPARVAASVEWID